MNFEGKSTIRSFDFMNIGVTGGMGAGKSFAAEALAEQLGVKSISADALCRDLLEVDQPGYLQFRKQFSHDFFLADGSINRPYLRDVIFSDNQQRKILDDILHPLVRLKLQELCNVATINKVDFVAEVPLLFEKGWQDDFDYTLVIFAQHSVCIERITNRDHVSKDDAEKSIASQMLLAKKCTLGDWVIDNSGSFAATLKLIEEFKGKILENTFLK